MQRQRERERGAERQRAAPLAHQSHAEHAHRHDQHHQLGERLIVAGEEPEITAEHHRRPRRQRREAAQRQRARERRGEQREQRRIQRAEQPAGLIDREQLRALQRARQMEMEQHIERQRLREQRGGIAAISTVPWRSRKSPTERRLSALPHTRAAVSAANASATGV